MEIFIDDTVVTICVIVGFVLVLIGIALISINKWSVGVSLLVADCILFLFLFENMASVQNEREAKIESKIDAIQQSVRTDGLQLSESQTDVLGDALREEIYGDGVKIEYVDLGNVIMTDDGGNPVEVSCYAKLLDKSYSSDEKTASNVHIELYVSRAGGEIVPVDKWTASEFEESQQSTPTTTI